MKGDVLIAVYNHPGNPHPYDLILDGDGKFVWRQHVTGNRTFATQNIPKYLTLHAEHVTYSDWF